VTLFDESVLMILLLDTKVRSLRQDNPLGIWMRYYATYARGHLNASFNYRSNTNE